MNINLAKQEITCQGQQKQQLHGEDNRVTILQAEKYLSHK